MTIETHPAPHLPEIEEAACAWAIRVEEPDFADWDGLTEWLERAPVHLIAYEAAVARADAAARLLAAKSKAAWHPQPEAEPAPPRRRWFAGVVAMAACVTAFAGWNLVDRAGPIEQIATAPGERRTIDLADGSRVILNGDTRITINRDTPRHVVLAGGEALFEVKHDERNPFVVVTGDTRLLDAGTVFNVVAEGGTLDVSVAEGAVIYRPGPNQVRLDAGQGLWRARADAAPVVRETDKQAVGGWRREWIHYDNASLDRIARDLARNLGRPVTVSGGTASLPPFNGTIKLDGEPGEVLARAAPLLGVTFTANGEGWIMSPAHGPSR